MASNNKIGRPRLYNSPEELQEKIDAYFAENPEKPIISGLCHYLGFESRQSFYAYEEKPDFGYTIKKARLRIEASYEARLYGNNVAGAIFALKNLGWKDSQEIDHKGIQTPIIEFRDFKKK